MFPKILLLGSILTSSINADACVWGSESKCCFFNKKTHISGLDVETFDINLIEDDVTKLVVSDLPNIQELTIEGKNLQELILDTPTLKKLTIRHTNLDTLDLSLLPNLTEIRLFHTNLNIVRISHKPVLHSLLVTQNRYTRPIQVIVSDVTALQHVALRGNYVLSLDKKTEKQLGMRTTNAGGETWYGYSLGETPAWSWDD